MLVYSESKISAISVLPALEDIETEWASRSLLHFVRQAWKIIEPTSPFSPNWHIEAITEHLQAVTAGQMRNLLITVPPRHGKSSVVSVLWPVWVWIKQPSFRWLFSSYALSLSIRDSVRCRRIIESFWYQSRWGDRFQLTSDQNQKMRFENNKSGYRLATSVGGANTGEGADALVCDDPHNVEESHSDTSREGVLTWWDEVMSTRGNDPKTSRRVIIQQRIHERDLAGHVLEQGGYEHLNLPTEYEPVHRVTSIGWSDPRKDSGELLWPNRFGANEIADLKLRLGSTAFAGQHQQRPAPAGGNIFKSWWWRYWQPKGMNLPPVMVQVPDGDLLAMYPEELPESFDEQVQSWDMAFKDMKDSDFVSGLVWGKKGANKYLLDRDHRRLDFVNSQKAVKAMSEKWPRALAKLIEDKANGPAIIASLKQEIAGLIAVEPDGDKVARAYAVTPTCEAGNVFLPHPNLYPWVSAYRHELEVFPNGANDDDVDATTQALKRWIATRRWLPVGT